MSDLSLRYLKITKYEPISGIKAVFVPKIGQIYEFFAYVEKNGKKRTKYLVLREKEGDKNSYPVPYVDIWWEVVRIEPDVLS